VEPDPHRNHRTAESVGFGLDSAFRDLGLRV
jgi:hypothetical protein